MSCISNAIWDARISFISRRGHVCILFFLFIVIFPMIAACRPGGTISKLVGTSSFVIWILRWQNCFNATFFTKTSLLPHPQSQVLPGLNRKVLIFWEGHILRNLHLTFVYNTYRQSRVRISQNFVAFSEYMNFDR